MMVMKFGGAVLKDAEGFRSMVRILQGADHSLVVVSALARTTRELHAAARSAVDQDLDTAIHTMNQLLERHSDLVQEVVTDTSHQTRALRAIKEVGSELESVLKGIFVTRQLTPRTLDRVLAFGEKLALDLSAFVLLSAGIDAKALDARRFMITTDLHGKAEPIVAKTRVHVERDLRPLLDSYRFIVTQGFVGATEDGDTTTMGQESSNMSATLLASLIDADEVTIWTDVEGVRSIDPDLSPRTMARRSMSYAEAKHAAHHGLKLMYPTMIEPAERAGIPIRIASAFASANTDEATLISKVGGGVGPLVNVYKKNGDDVRQVSVVFTTVPEWTSALSNAIEVLNEPESCFVISDPTEEVVTFTVPAHDASDFAVRLHELIVLRKENA